MTDGQTNLQTNWKDSPVDGLSFRQTGGLMDKQTDGKLMDKWKNGSADRYTKDSHTDRQTEDIKTNWQRYGMQADRYICPSALKQISS